MDYIGDFLGPTWSYLATSLLLSTGLSWAMIHNKVRQVHHHVYHIHHSEQSILSQKICCQDHLFFYNPKQFIVCLIFCLGGRHPTLLLDGALSNTWPSPPLYRKGHFWTRIGPVTPKDGSRARCLPKACTLQLEIWGTGLPFAIHLKMRLLLSTPRCYLCFV